MLTKSYFFTTIASGPDKKKKACGWKDQALRKPQGRRMGGVPHPKTALQSKCFGAQGSAMLLQPSGSRGVSKPNNRPELLSSYFRSVIAGNFIVK